MLTATVLARLVVASSVSSSCFRSLGAAVASWSRHSTVIDCVVTVTNDTGHARTLCHQWAHRAWTGFET